MPDWRSGPGVSHNQKVLPPSNTFLSSFFPFFYNTFSSTLWYIATSGSPLLATSDHRFCSGGNFPIHPAVHIAPLQLYESSMDRNADLWTVGHGDPVSDICPDIVHEHNVFSLKWNTELSTCKREELMLSTYYYLNKPFKEILTSQSESVFSCSSRPPGREGFSVPFHCLAQYHYNSDKSQVREREPGFW